jgi:hypothetical protein
LDSSGFLQVYNPSEAGGSVLQTSTSLRAPIFYDSDDTTYYINPANTATSAYFAGNVTLPNTINAGIRNAAADAYVWVDDAYGNFYIKNASGGFYGDFTGYNFRSTNSVVWATMGATYFQHNTQLRSPIYYDSDNTNYYIDAASSSYVNNLYGETSYIGRYFQRNTGVPTNNLGTPTVTEMALFQEQFDNKTAFYPIANIKFYTSTNGSTWTEYTSFSDTDKRKFVGGNAASGIVIPNNTPYFRIEIINNGAYVFLDALYMYWSGNPHSTTVKIKAIRNDDLVVQWTNSNTQIGSWPGHMYLPFNSIPFVVSAGSTGHYKTIHIDFQPTWTTTGIYASLPINLFNMQVWGGYPASKRTIFSVDENRNTTFPGDVRAPIFYDSDDTAFYINPNSTSRFSSVQTVGITGIHSAGSTGIDMATNDNYVSMRVIRNSVGATYNDGMYIGYGNSNSGLTRLYGGGATGGAFEKHSDHSFEPGSFRAPIFYDSNDTAFYVNPNSTSQIGSTYVNGYFQVQYNSGNQFAGMGIRNNYGSASAQSTAFIDFINENGIQKASIFGRIATDGAGYLEFLSTAGGVSRSTDTRTTTAYAYSNQWSFQTSAGISANIVYDRDDTAYYIDPNSTSRVKRIILDNGDNLSWGAVYGAGVPTIAATTNTAIFFYPTGSTAGAAFTMYGSYAITSDMRAATFTDSNDTSFYLDPASSSYLGIITAKASNDVQLYLNGNGTSWAGINWADVAGNDNIWYNGSGSTFAIGGGGSNVANKKLHVHGGMTIGSGIAASSSGVNNLLVESAITSNQMYSQIFYDSQNGAYYIDPASVSNINSLLTQAAISNNVNGLRNIHPGGGTYVTGSSSVSGAIKIKLPETVYPMMRFTVRVYTYDGLSFDIYCGGHTSSALWYNTFAYMTTQNRSALNVRFTYDGTNMYVMIGELAQSWTYPQVFITDVQVGYTNYEYTRWDDGWVISFETSTYHTVGSTHQVFPPTSSTNNVNPAYASVFYDSNNTGYYFDGAGTTNLNDLIIANNIASPANYYNGLQLELQATSGTAGIGLHRAGYSHCGIYHDTSDVLKFNFNSATVTLNAGAGTLIGDGNDTTYIRYKGTVTSEDWNTYIDGTEASYRIVVNGSGSNRPGAYMYGVLLSMAGASQAKFQLYAPHNGTDGNGLWVRTGWDTDYDAWNQIAINSIAFTNNVSLSAPIFYDSNNTGYYVDPASTSNLNGLTVAGTITGSVSGNAGGSSNRLASTRDTPSDSLQYWQASGLGTTEAPSGDWHNTIRMGHGSPLSYYSNTLAIRMTGTGVGDIYTQTIMGGAAQGWKKHWNNADATISASGDFRAPIFYDSNNTGYYMDAASGTVLNEVYNYGWYRTYGDQGWYSQTHGGGIFMQDSTYVRVYNGKGLYVPNEILATGNITAYYSDERLKTRTGKIENAIDKVKTLDGFYYVENETAKELGYNNDEQQVGLSAQQVQAILPEAVHMAAVDVAVDEDGNKYSKTGEEYLTVDYSRLVPLLIEAIKELKAEIEELKAR